MNKINTNQELYQFVARLIKTHKQTERSLQEYLLALWNLAQEKKAESSLSVLDFVSFLEKAFTAPVPSIALLPKVEKEILENSVTLSNTPTSSLSDFQKWEQTIISQILDLDFMQKDGTIEDEYRYFGIECLRGFEDQTRWTWTRWYNFDPCGFLECGAAGTFHGWTDESDTGRILVPGQVTVLDEQGKLTSVDPQDIEDEIEQLEDISWERFTQFLDHGQTYE